MWVVGSSTGVRRFTIAKVGIMLVATGINCFRDGESRIRFFAGGNVRV